MESDRRKDTFLATLAHELRNPLAPISNAMQYFRLKGGPADPDVQQFTDIIERQTRQMTRLVDDLLDISRINRDKLELRKESVDLASVVQTAVETAPTGPHGPRTSILGRAAGRADTAAGRSGPACGRFSRTCCTMRPNSRPPVDVSSFAPSADRTRSS